MAALHVTSMFRSVALRNFWWMSILQLSSFLSILFVTSVVIAAPQKKQPNTCNHLQDVLQFKLLGTLGSHKSDDNGNTTKAIGLISKTTIILQVHLPFFVHFFAVTAWLQRDNA